MVAAERMPAGWFSTLRDAKKSQNCPDNGGSRRGALVSRKLCQDIELIEALSAESLFRHAPEDYASQQGLAVRHLGSAVMHLVKRRNKIEFNSVIGLGMRSPATVHQIQRIQDWYSSHGMHRFAISLSPAALPHELNAWLGRRHFRKRAGLAKFYRGDEAIAPPAATFRIREIGPDRIKDWYRVLIAVYPRYGPHLPWAGSRIGQTGWRHYVAYAGRTPVAIGSMFVADGTARLLDGVTTKMHRGRGAQSALIARRLSDGMKQGCRLFTSETSAPTSHQSHVSHRNLLRAGFELAYVRTDHVHERPHARRA